MNQNPRLTGEQLGIANRLLAEFRDRLAAETRDDRHYLWALRRKIAKELVYDERGHPSHRNKIKKLKREEQNGLCYNCGEPLPEKYCVLDRLHAVDGYTVENTHLIHQDCDHEIQKSRGYA